MAARILLIGDSHTRNMSLAFSKYLPSTPVYTLTMPQGIEEIAHKYHTNRTQITNFHPTIVIIHAGHNDIVFHHRHNNHPRNPQIVIDQIFQLMNEVLLDHPGIMPCVSSIFPRTSTLRSYLPESAIIPYNKKVKRHGQNLMTITRNTSITCLVNNCLWHRISSATENANYFDIDGLHLSTKGKEAVVREWLTLIFPDMTFPELTQDSDQE